MMLFRFAVRSAGGAILIFENKPKALYELQIDVLSHLVYSIFFGLYIAKTKNYTSSFGASYDAPRAK